MKSQKRRAKAMFCTECGSELDEFWNSDAAGDFKELLKHRIECLQNGRPHNRMCSKLFMATPPNERIISRSRAKVSTRKLSSLKSSVMEKIMQTEIGGNGGAGNGRRKVAKKEGRQNGKRGK